MDKFLSLDFGVMLIIFLILLVLHEAGHYLAYRMLGFEAVIRKSILVPGIDPKNTITVNKLQGLIIALGGFVFSTVVVVLPSVIIDYKYWFVLLIGSLAGSCVDFIWAFNMIFMKTVTIQSR
jgi:hypothetical protein